MRSGNDKIERVTFAYESEPSESFEKINVLAEFQKDWACVLQLYQLLLELVNDPHPGKTPEYYRGPVTRGGHWAGFFDPNR